MPKRKKNIFKKITPYHCIQLWYDQGQYYEGNDRIRKNSTLDQAINYVRTIANKVKNPYLVKIINEKHEEVYKHTNKDNMASV